MAFRIRTQHDRCTWLIAAACVLGALALSGCAEKPADVVQRLFDASQEEDWDAMTECMAPDLREMMRELQSISGKDTAQQQLMQKDANAEDFLILDTQVEGDWADVQTSVTLNGQESKSTIRVHKIDGAWYVDFPEEQKQQMKAALEMVKKMAEMKSNMPELPAMPKQ